MMDKNKLLIIGMVCGLLGGVFSFATKDRGSIAAQSEDRALSIAKYYAEKLGITVQQMEFMPSMPECKTYLDNKLAEMRLWNPNIEIVSLKEYMKNQAIYAFAAAESETSLNAVYCIPSNKDGSGKAAYLHGTITN